MRSSFPQKIYCTTIYIQYNGAGIDLSGGSVMAEIGSGDDRRRKGPASALTEAVSAASGPGIRDIGSHRSASRKPVNGRMGHADVNSSETWRGPAGAVRRAPVNGETGPADVNSGDVPPRSGSERDDLDPGATVRSGRTADWRGRDEGSRRDPALSPSPRPPSATAAPDPGPARARCPVRTGWGCS